MAITLRDYMNQQGQKVGYDAATGKVTIGGKQFASGSIPGTTFNPATGQHVVTNPSALNSALGGASSGSKSSKSTSGTTTSLRDYMKQIGQPIDYDASTGMTTIGGKQYALGSIPGTSYNPTTGQHYVTDPSALNSILGIDKQPVAKQTYMQPYQQYISDQTSEYINQLKEAQRRSRIAALDKTKEAALRALDTEKANVSPTYYDARNRAAAASDVGAMNFAQYMAARGIKGAAGAMPEIYRQAGLQGQIGALDRQEAANLAAIERQRSNVESGYASDVAAANADVESQAMQAMIDQWNQNRQYELQRGALTGSLGDERTLAGQQFDYSRSPSNPEVQAAILANRQRELEIAAQEIQNSYLPATLKLQAERLAQQVKTGSLDYDTALAQLNQIKAQINALNRPARSTPKEDYINNIYRKLSEGQELTADERAAIGLKATDTLDNKTSVDNYYAVIAEVGKAQTIEEARRVLQANADQLNDTDYRKALAEIEYRFGTF